MLDEQRPSGRRSLLRGIALALLALVAPGAASDAAQGAQPPAIAVFADAALPYAPIAAPDGAIVGVDYRYDSEGHTAGQLIRVAPDGTVTRRDIPPPNGPLNSLWLTSALAPQLDGTTGAIVKQVRGHRPVGAELLRLDASGAVVSRSRLPMSAARANRLALESDGTAWWALVCRDRLYRSAPDGTVTVIRLPRRGCGSGQGTGDPESGTALTVGADGAVWIVNLCGRRVVRYGADGHVREWRPRHGHCVVGGIGEDYLASPALTVDPRGGVAWYTDERFFGAPQPDGHGGRILPGGRLLSLAPTGLPGFIAADGSAWFRASRVAPDGRRATPLRLPRQYVLEVEQGRGGVLLLGNAGTFHDEYKSSSWGFYDAAIAFAGDDGTRVDWPLAQLVGQETADGEVGEAVVGADGALWFDLSANRTQPHRLLRLLPSGLPEPQAPDAVPSGRAARAGRVVTLPLACRADVGRWCSGTVALDGVAAPVRFLVPGQRRAGVRVTLDGAAAARLRSGLAVAATATVTSDGAGTATRALRLRAGA